MRIISLSVHIFTDVSGSERPGMSTPGTIHIVALSLEPFVNHISVPSLDSLYMQHMCYIGKKKDITLQPTAAYSSLLCSGLISEVWVDWYWIYSALAAKGGNVHDPQGCRAKYGTAGHMPCGTYSVYY